MNLFDSTAKQHAAPMTMNERRIKLYALLSDEQHHPFQELTAVCDGATQSVVAQGLDQLEAAGHTILWIRRGAENATVKMTKHSRTNYTTRKGTTA